MKTTGKAVCISGTKTVSESKIYNFETVRKTVWEEYKWREKEYYKVKNDNGNHVLVSKDKFKILN